MIAAAQALLAELDQEAIATRRILARVPDTHLDWRPHGTSLTLGQLANHIATTPGAVARLASLDGLDGAAVDFNPAPATRAADLLPALEGSLSAARAFLAGLTEETAAAPWRLSRGPHEVATMPRIGVMRAIGMNHWYHHRGQLTVYLRQLGVPVPAIYGRSADENPFEG